MMIDPAQVTYQDCYKLMIGSIVPRPIALVATVSETGVLNLAPFSYFTAVASKPPTICFCPARRSPHGDKKDTLTNIEQTGEFVVNVVTEAIGAQMNETATDFPPHIDEFEAAGLTPVPSDVVTPPRVKESPINMECRLDRVIHIGEAGAGGGALVLGEIVCFHVADRLYRDGRIDIDGLKPLGRLAGNGYTTLGKRISMTIKKYNDAE